MDQVGCGVDRVVAGWTGWLLGGPGGCGAALGQGAHCIISCATTHCCRCCHLLCLTLSLGAISDTLPGGGGGGSVISHIYIYAYKANSLMY